MACRHALLGAILAATLLVGHAGAQVARSSSDSARQSPGDAWWTGPMLANSAATLPRGHVLVESYLYDVASSGRYDAERIRQRVPRSDSYGSQTYMLYGLADRLSAGMLPTFGYNATRGGPHSTRVGVGDLGVMAQLRLTAMDPHRRMPTISVNVQETLPTGRYDRLGEGAADGFGGGAWTTTLSVYSQKYFWMPTGRILRMRVDVSQAFPGSVKLEDVSVYGTQAGFRGRAMPGQSLSVDGAWEYSVTQRWVLALDATYRHARSTEVTADVPAGAPAMVSSSEPGDATGLAPAIEYNWSGNAGILLGVRVIPAGRNTASSTTPAIAINIVR